MIELLYAEDLNHELCREVCVSGDEPKGVEVGGVYFQYIKPDFSKVVRNFWNLLPLQASKETIKGVEVSIGARSARGLWAVLRNAIGGLSPSAKLGRGVPTEQR